ncbi:A24 family peptidase [Lachnospiraceae bacterium 54-53]
MNGILEACLFAGLNSLIAYFLPDLANSFACYKNRKKGDPAPWREPDAGWRRTAALFAAAVAGAAGYWLPPDRVIFVMAVCHAAVFGVCVDALIRIIANEMLWVLLAAGLPYRIYSGGLRGLWGSAGALLLVIAVFGLTALFTFARKGTAGVGMGDVKLAMVIAVTVGWPGVFYFLAGVAAAIGIYCVIGVKCGWLSRGSTFPMCGQIMAGFLAALLWPSISTAVL